MTPANEDNRATQPVMGTVLVSYALGELDAEEQAALEKKLQQTPALREELNNIREHLEMHQDLRKVAPRRGSFERLHARMNREGSFEGAVPGAHCMARRSFVASLVFGIIAVVLLAIFTAPRVTMDQPDVIGVIARRNPAVVSGGDRGMVDRQELRLNQRYDLTDGYDASLWLPTGQAGSSSLDIARDAIFTFSDARHLNLETGTIRGLEVSPGGVTDGPFIVLTAHGQVQVEEGRLAVAVTRDGAQTQVSVIEGTARVVGLNSETAFQVTAGYCTSIERGKLPQTPRPMLELSISTRTGSEYELDAVLRNTGFVPVKITRAMSSKPVYVLHASYTAEFDPGSTPENTTLAPVRVNPMPETGETGSDHRGEAVIEPGKYYRFTFEISSVFIATPPVEFWLRLEYRGDLYAPAGQAKVKIHSRDLRVDRRK